MRTVDVRLGSRTYPIRIGSGLLQAASELIVPVLKIPQVAIVSNEIVAPLYVRELAAGLARAGVDVVPVVLPDGEAHKDWETLNLVFTGLLEARCERATTVIALGGGVVGDMAGFAASAYQRGVPFIQVPTTLLSQVDSSVGGKTAINHPLGKNMIGAFYQPRLVIADVDTLATLPVRELRTGLAEVIKHAAIRDAERFAWLEENLDGLLACDRVTLVETVEWNCRIKAAVVAADETERGERALLNFGHTFGHAIEAGLGFGVWSHGEAVAAGMVMAATLSVRLGLIPPGMAERLQNLLVRAGLPVRAPKLGSARYLDLMRHDKKVEAGHLRLVLLDELGRASVRDGIPETEIVAAIESCCD